jgi:CubicO group peptidase (beta-lactamase class C family)
LPPPPLAERLDRLAAEFDRNRVDLHVPGAVLGIVRGEEVIFARGFGVADIEKKTPVTPTSGRSRTRSSRSPSGTAGSCSTSRHSWNLR